jgi:hypothetical protein
MVNISGLVISEHPSNNKEFIPSNSTFAIRIDGREIVENTLFSIILESKDEAILKLFEETINKRTSGEKEFTNTGINYLSDIVIFKAPFEGKEVNGILFNLLNRATFLKNMPDLIGKGQVVAANENIGIILTSSNLKNSSKHLQSFAETIVKTKNKGHHKIFHYGSAPHRFSEIHFHSSSNSNSETEINLVFEQKEQAFELNGNMISENKINFNDLSHILKPDGLHITSKLFSDEWADSLRSYLSFLSKDLPEIKAFSMNYRGVNVINHSSGFMAIPDAELIIQCNDDFNVSDFLHDPELSGSTDCELTESFIRFDTEILYYKQLSPKCFYIGKEPDPKLAENNRQSLFIVSGDLNPLTNIKGGGMMTAFLEMVPIFKASKNLAKSSEKINMTITCVSNNQAKINGSFLFKEGHYPMSEIMRFMLNGNLIK